MKHAFIPTQPPKAALFEDARDYVEEPDYWAEEDESAWRLELKRKQDDVIDNICGFCGHHNPTDGDCPTCKRIYEARY